MTIKAGTRHVAPAPQNLLLGRFQRQNPAEVLPGGQRGEEPLHRAGYTVLLLTALALPFEATQRPLLHTRYITVTNLKVLFYLLVALAAITMAGELRARSTGEDHRRLPLALFAALLVSALISSYLSHHRTTGLKWTLDLALGALIWLAIPIWLRRDTERKVRTVGLALVTGALLAAAAGGLELWLGPGLTRHLLWFKPKETTIGPYPRLSGTFEYANIAALYFELTLPFAAAGFLSALTRERRAWWASVVWLLAFDGLLCALLLTYSRGALLGLAASLLAVIYALRRQLLSPFHLSRRWLFVILAVLGLSAGLVVLQSPALAVLRFTSESDQSWYRVAYKASPPSPLRAGQRLDVRVTVTNLGPLTWNARGAQPYHLGYHWLSGSGAVVDFDPLRSSLSTDLAPGRSQTVIAHVRAPGRPGSYLLTWDMVQEGVTWFSLKSGTYTTSPVRVVGPPVVNQGPSGIRGPATLPRMPMEPSRSRLWAAALRMVRARPLFGVGPASYRLEYGTFARPRQQSWDTRVLANSLPLETFADLGLIGGGLFWAFLAAVMSGLAAGVWRGRIGAPWQLATVGAVAAFLGHGLVDYILGSDAIFILFWILCGCAAIPVPNPARPLARREA